MKKKSVSLITAVGVLVILSGAYVGVTAYVAKQDAAEAENEEEEKTEIVSIASSDVKSIKFVIDKKEVTFEKDGDSWVKSDEKDFPVDQDKIDTLVGSLSSVTAERTLEDVEDPSEYELDDPENTVTVITEDGKETVIQLGMVNDFTSQEYIDLNKDSSTVYVVSNSTFSSFEGTLYDFAKSGTFPTVDSSTISKISVDGEKTSYSLEKDENNFWNITAKDDTEKADSVEKADAEKVATEKVDTEKADTEKADSAKATSLASAVSGIAYSSYVNYNCADNQLSEYGLDKPYAEITVDYQEEVEEESTKGENEAENGTESVSEISEDESLEPDDSADDSDDNVETDLLEGESNADENASEEADAAEEDSVEEDDTEASATEENTVEENDTEASAAEENVVEKNATDENATEGDDAEANAAEENVAEKDDAETEPEMVDRELIIQIGDQSSDGGRYVRVNDSNEIYTISEDTLDTFLEKTNADFWDLTVSYLSVNDLEKLDVEYKGEEYSIDVSRETSEDDAQSSDEDADTSEDENSSKVSDAENTDGSETSSNADKDADENTDADGNTFDDENTDASKSADENGNDSETSGNADDTAINSANTSSATLSYALNGNKLESTTFTTFYNKLINMAAQKRLTDEFESNNDPEMTVKFISTGGNENDVDYYSYDTNYYAAVSDGKVYLVNKMTVKELFQSFESVIGENDMTNDEATENETAETEQE